MKTIALQAVAENMKAAQGARRAIRWLDGQRNRFRVGDDGGEPVPDHESALPWRIKPIGELVFMLMILRRSGVSSRRLTSLDAFAIAECSQVDWHALASYDPSSASPLAMIGDFFQLYGRPMPFDVGMLRKLDELDYFAGLDRFPYRSMDVIYAFSRIGFPERRDELVKLFAETPFGKCQLQPRYSIDDIYSLTHAIFYLSDVGFLALETMLPPDEVIRLRTTLFAMIAIMVRSDNCDVLGELLLCTRLCRFQPQGVEQIIYRVGILRLLAAQCPRGSVASTVRSRQRAGKGEATFKELYHTTLVAALALSLRWSL